MGGEGAMMQAIHSLRNNSRRNKREAFEGWTGFDEASQGIKIEPVSEEVLQGIRDKLKMQRQSLLRRRLIASGLVIVLIVGTIVYNMN